MREVMVPSSARVRAPLERDVLQEIRLELGREPDLTLWRNSTGVTVELGAAGDRRTIRYGLAVGSSDLIGILAPSGRLVALEIKSSTGRVTSEQVQFLEVVRRRGGFGAVVRSVDEARAALERARRGANE